MYLCAMSIDFASFYDFWVGFWILELFGKCCIFCFSFLLLSFTNLKILFSFPGINYVYPCGFEYNITSMDESDLYIIRWDVMIVRFVDISGIVDHRCLSFLFIIIIFSSENIDFKMFSVYFYFAFTICKILALKFCCFEMKD